DNLRGDRRVVELLDRLPGVVLAEVGEAEQNPWLHKARVRRHHGREQRHGVVACRRTAAGPSAKRAGTYFSSVWIARLSSSSVLFLSPFLSYRAARIVIRVGVGCGLMRHCASLQGRGWGSTTNPGRGVTSAPALTPPL